MTPWRRMARTLLAGPVAARAQPADVDTAASLAARLDARGAGAAGPQPRRSGTSMPEAAADARSNCAP